MTPIFGIDPGNTHSAYCVYYPDTHTLGDFGKVDNADMRDILRESRQWEHDYYIEMIASYGMPVGATVFDTCVWVGRFTEIIKKECEYIYRKDIKMELCGTTKAKDGNVRQAIIDRFPGDGGGATPSIGIKSKPGPLYGVSKDVWAALGVCLTARSNH